MVISTLQLCREGRLHKRGAQSVTYLLLTDLQAAMAASGPYRDCCLLFPSLGEKQGQHLSLGHGPEQGQLSWRGLNELPVCILATYILPFGGGGGLPSPGIPAQLWLA